MNWIEMVQNPTLKNLPFKIQTDKWGNVLMSPATNEHGIYQAKITQLISRFTTSGLVITECSIQTKEGVKVADVVFASDEFINRNKGNTPYKEAPEICIEILSPSNSHQEMEEKKEFYFARGAREVWICTQKGYLEFYTYTGQLERSALIKHFPSKIDLYLR